MIIKAYVVVFFPVDESLIFLCNLIAMLFLSHKYHNMGHLQVEGEKKKGQW